MTNTIESVARKARLLEKKRSIQRKEASEMLEGALDALGAESFELLTFLASEATMQSSKPIGVWGTSFRSNSTVVFDHDWTDQIVVFKQLYRIVDSLPNKVVYVFGNDWERQGAAVVSTDFFASHIEDLCGLFDDSFVLLDASMANALRFEADEVGGRYSIAEVYVVGDQWVKSAGRASTSRTHS